MEQECQNIYNQAIDHSIIVVKDVIQRLKEEDTNDKAGHANVLEQIITLLINLKK
jgi:hypothetical protein